jgi:hypothetical protein
MIAPSQRTDFDPLGRARALAVVVGGGVLVSGALGWGRAGLVAAALGTALSLVNVWALHRFARRAVASVALAGPAAASAQLSSALGVKTAMLLASVWLVARSGSLATVPFALGLLVAVFALLGAGLLSALHARVGAQAASPPEPHRGGVWGPSEGPHEKRGLR